MSLSISIFTSIFWCTSSSISLIILYKFYSIYLSILRRNNVRVAERKRRNFVTMIWIYQLLFLVAPLCGIWGLYFPLDFNFVLIVHFLFQGLCNLGFSAMSFVAFSTLILSLNSSIKSMPLRDSDRHFAKHLHTRLSRIRKELVLQYFYGGVLLFIFASWPYLRMKIVYQIPIQALTWMIICLAISIALSYSGKESEKRNVQIVVNDNTSPEDPREKVNPLMNTRLHSFFTVFKSQPLITQAGSSIYVYNSNIENQSILEERTLEIGHETMIFKLTKNDTRTLKLAQF